MRQVSRAIIVRLAAAFLMLAGLFALPLGHPSLFTQSAAAQTPDAETQAFEAAKSLGTSEAWNAFLTHYPSGFRADLARAYLKQLAPTATSAAPTAPTGPEKAAIEQVCAEPGDLRSRESREPAKLRFINESGTTLILQWIDFNGRLKEYATLQPGADITQDTFITHPWIVAYQEGSCRQIFLPDQGTSVARLRPEAELPKRAAPVAKSEPKKAKVYVDDDPPLKCGTNYKNIRGRCVLMQNCGANAYRSPEGDCYCNKNYSMRNGKCVWKTDKNGYEINPEKKSGCSSWQRQCNQGSASGCAKYESNCQVN